MLINSSQLPDKGKRSSGVGSFNIYPLTFRELLRYLGDEQTTETQEYVRALTYMVQLDPEIAKVSLLNADYLIYIFKALSASKDLKLILRCNCEYCGKPHSVSVKLNAIEFNDLSDKALSIKYVTINGKKIRFGYSTIGDFIAFIGRLGRYEDNIGIDALKLACMLKLPIDESLKVISNAHQDGIAVIHKLDQMLFNLIEPIYIKCPEHKELRGTAATFRMSAADFFQDVLQLSKLDEDSILFDEICKTE